MSKKHTTMAICYDFDGTLSPKNMQEYGFLPELGQSPRKFWEKAANHAKENAADPILSYMYLMVNEANKEGLQITRDAFRKHGRTVQLFAGVDTWFKRINAYARQNSIKLEHYIVSSGLKEMIEGSAIARYFEKIYACSFVYDQHGVVCWPAYAMNYTTKTQFLFRINKGIKDDTDNMIINQYQPDEERTIPFSRMIYIGDGVTDVPCMKLVKEKGGFAISVFGRGKRTASEQLLSDERVNFIAGADYREGKRVDQIVKGIIDRQAAVDRLHALKPKKKPVVTDVDSVKDKVILVQGRDVVADENGERD